MLRVKYLFRTVYTLFFAIVLLCLFSCGGKSVPSDAGVSDTVAADSADSAGIVPADSIMDDAVIPKTADEYFNDFIYSFTISPRHQKERIVFPLPYERDGKMTYVKPEQWRYNAMYTRQEFYTAFFENESSLDLEKSKDVDRVTVEYVDMIDERVKDYFFSREENQWKLRKMREYGLDEYHERDFILFFDRFVSDSLYQISHVASKIEISMPDPEDDIETLTGMIEAEQWPSFRPELPHEYYYNINYGQKMENKKYRVVALEGSSNGFLSLLFFRQKGYGEWMLYKMKN